MTDFGLRGIVTRLSQNLSRDRLVQETTDFLRNYLNCDRVILYYFYQKWEGQVTFESLSNSEYSIFGSQGPDECFNQEYANLYEARRISHLDDIETSAIADCHREFLRKLQVRANLVAPILTEKGLWGLLIAHHCHNTHIWSPAEIDAIKQGANQIAQAELICNS
jgi:GAF domain-containing protein